MVSGLIRSNIDALDKYLESLLPDPEDNTAVAHPITIAFDTSEYDKFRELGSGLKPCTFSEIEEKHQGDRAFERFRIRLGKFMSRFLEAYSIPLPGGKAIAFHVDDMVCHPTPVDLPSFYLKSQITEYQYIKVKYRCTGDWQMKTDYMRCNPNFYGSPRYDCVLVECDPKPYYARLICIFTCTVGTQEYPIALIQPYSSDIPGLTQSQKAHDADLELHRLRANMRDKCEFVSIHTFIRGAVLTYSDETTRDGMPSRDYFVFDLLDADLFCRGRERLEDIGG